MFPYFPAIHENWSETSRTKAISWTSRNFQRNPSLGENVAKCRALQFYFTYTEACKGMVTFEQAPGGWRGGNVVKLPGELVKCSHDFNTIEGGPVHV